jgi:TonB family protein
MAKDRFLISLALALAIHALALLAVEMILRNQRERMPEYSGPLFVLLEEVPVIARSLPSAPVVVSEPRAAESVQPAETSPRTVPPPAATVRTRESRPPAGGAAPGSAEAAPSRPAPESAAPAVREPAPPPARRSEPFVPEEVVIPPAGRGEPAETAGAASAAPEAAAPAAVMPLTELDSALRDRRDEAPAGGPEAGGSRNGDAGTPAETPADDGFLIQWEDPSQGREATSRPLPALPAWVSEQGLRLKITVSFVLNPQGTLDDVRTEEGSGYTDVDAAVLEALRRWKFKPVAGTRSVRGRVSYIIRPR